MKIKRKNITFYSIVLATLAPYSLIPYTDRIRDYFAIKLLIMMLAIMTVRRLPYPLIILMFFPYLTTLWGDLSYETIITNGGFWTSYLLIFILGFQLHSYNINWPLATVLLGLEPIYAQLTIGGVGESINGAYLIGYTFTIVLLFWNKYQSSVWKYIYIIFLAYTGIGRTIMVATLAAIRRPIYILILGLTGVGLMTYITATTTNIVLYSALLGYRIFEYAYVLSGTIIELMIGRGLGTDLKEVTLGTKGIVTHGGRFHNFYLTLIFNYGIIFTAAIGFVLMRLVFSRKVSRAAKVSLVTWSVVAMMDGPRDGYWPIFLTLGVCYGQFKNINCHSSLLPKRI